MCNIVETKKHYLISDSIALHSTGNVPCGSGNASGRARPNRYHYVQQNDYNTLSYGKVHWLSICSIKGYCFVIIELEGSRISRDRLQDTIARWEGICETIYWLALKKVVCRCGLGRQRWSRRLGTVSAAAQFEPLSGQGVMHLMVWKSEKMGLF